MTRDQSMIGDPVYIQCHLIDRGCLPWSNILKPAAITAAMVLAEAKEKA
jgi:hypothetical protein